MIKRILLLVFVALSCLAALAEHPAGEKIDRKAFGSVPRFNIEAAGGGGFILSKYYLPKYTSGNPKIGPELSAAFDWLSKSGLGGGATFTSYFSSYRVNGGKYTVRSIFYGPHFVVSQPVDNAGRWVLTARIAAGISQFWESGEHKNSEGGFATNMMVGAEYRMTRTVGVIGNIGILRAFYGKNPDAAAYDGEFDYKGMTQLTVNVGLRFHF